QWIAAGCIVALSLVAIFLLPTLTRVTPPAHRAQSPSAASSTSGHASDAIPTVSLFLLPGVSRSPEGNSAQTLQFPLRPSTIRVLLRVNRPGLRYDAIVTREDGAVVQRFPQLGSTKNPDRIDIVELAIPSDILKPGLYIIVLHTKETNGKARIEEA